MKRGRLLISYLRSRRAFAVCMPVCIGIFALLFYLYDLPWEALGYGLVLCLVPGGILFAYSFRRFCRQYDDIARTGENISLLIGELSVPEDAVLSAYDGALRSLCRQVQRLEEEAASGRQNSLDYYTAWVHQIKTPIAVMKLELQEEDSERNRDLLIQLFRIEEYVDMALCYLRLDSRSTDFVFRECAVDDIIRRVLRKYSSLFVRKKLRLEYTPAQATVLTDEKWLGFILEQLLSNAIKYTDKGFVRIFFDENQILHVQDSGIGIAPEDLPRIFERGFTGGNGRENRKSTGLGLYLSRQAAERIGARLRVESVQGQGTHVQIALSHPKLLF